MLWNPRNVFGHPEMIAPSLRADSLPAKIGFSRDWEDVCTQAILHRDIPQAAQSQYLCISYREMYRNFTRSQNKDFYE